MIRIVEQELRHCRNMTGGSNVLSGSGSNPPSVAGGYGDSRVDISDSMVIGESVPESGCHTQNFKRLISSLQMIIFPRRFILCICIFLLMG